MLPVNSHFQGFAKAMGLRPGHSKAVLPDVGNQTFMTAFFEMLDAQVGGRNYWWPDNACALYPCRHLPIDLKPPGSDDRSSDAGTRLQTERRSRARRA